MRALFWMWVLMVSLPFVVLFGLLVCLNEIMARVSKVGKRLGFTGRELPPNAVSEKE